MKLYKNINWSLLFLIILSSILMFPNLGERITNGDESNTVMFAKSIYLYGKIVVEDDKNIYTDAEDPVRRYTDDEYLRKRVFIDIASYPHMQFYLSALGFFIFDINPFGARIFFALFGIATLVMLYYLIIKLSGDKRKAFLTCLLFALFVPFYLYSRNARYYSLTMFFCVFVVYSYIRFIRKEKHGHLLFIISNVFSFYAYYISFFAVYIGTLLYTLLSKKTLKLSIKSKELKDFIYNSFFIVLFTLPGFLLWKSYKLILNRGEIGYIWQERGLNILISAIMPIIYVMLYVFPIVFILYALKLRKRRHYNLILIIIFISFILPLAAGHIGLRHYAYTFSLYFIIIGDVFYHIIGKKKILGAILIFVFVFSNLIYVFPFVPFRGMLLDKLDPETDAYYFVKDNFQLKFPLVDYLYEITHDYSGPEKEIINYLQKNAKKEDVVLTNVGGSNLITYTNLIIFRTSLNKSPDWIIPRKPYYIWGDKETYNYVISFVNESYEKILIPTVDYPYLYDLSHPRPHRFRQVNSPQRKYDTYPIEIYHLKK